MCVIYKGEQDVGTKICIHFFVPLFFMTIFVKVNKVEINVTHYLFNSADISMILMQCRHLLL